MEKTDFIKEVDDEKNFNWLNWSTFDLRWYFFDSNVTAGTT